MRYLLTILLFIVSFSLAQTQSIVQYDFESRMDGVSFLWTGDTLNFWGFRDLNDTTTTEAILPGPTIYCDLGDSVIINMTNPSFEAHTIHLHGLDVDQANDGVPSTSFFIQPNQTGSYSFKATQAGNYLYHCHVGTVLHLQLGMYGAVIVRLANNVKEVYPGGPAYDRDFEWLTIEVDKSWHDDYTSIGAFTNYNPDYFHVNGKSRQDINADSSISVYNAYVGEKILLRLMNVGYGLNQYIFPQGITASQITSDGRALPNIEIDDTLRIFPGERYGVLIEASQLLNDSIEIQYLSMYRDKIWGKEYVPVVVNSLASLETENNEAHYFYPNPFIDEIKFQGEIGGKFEICDLHGKVLRKGEVLREGIVNLGGLTRGIYIIKVFEHGKAPLFRKLVKK